MPTVDGQRLVPMALSDLKTGNGESRSWVRIPPHPLFGMASFTVPEARRRPRPAGALPGALRRQRVSHPSADVDQPTLAVARCRRWTSRATSPAPMAAITASAIGSAPPPPLLEDRKHPGDERQGVCTHGAIDLGDGRNRQPPGRLAERNQLVADRGCPDATCA